MKGLELREPVSSLFPQGKTNHIEKITAHDGTVQAFSILGTFAGTSGPMFAVLMDAPLVFNVFPASAVTAILFGLLGAGAGAGAASTFSTANHLKKELRKHKSIERISGLKMLSFRGKETIVDMGKDIDGNDIKAIVRSNRSETKVEYMTLPSPLETWDRAAAYVMEVHNLAPKESQKLLAS